MIGAFQAEGGWLFARAELHSPARPAKVLLTTLWAYSTCVAHWCAGPLALAASLRRFVTPSRLFPSNLRRLTVDVWNAKSVGQRPGQGHA